MKNFNSIGRGVALATSTLALGSVMAVSSTISSAQAAVIGSFNSGINVTTGNLTAPSPATDTITFSGPFDTGATTGVFSGLQLASLSTITVATPGTPTTIGATTITAYTPTALSNPFLTFTNGSKFVLDTGFNATRIFTAGATVAANQVIYNFTSLTGKFLDASNNVITAGILDFNPITTGVITTNQINDGSQFGSFSLSLSTVADEQPTPEPTATIGLAALGLGAFVTKSNFSKKNKVKVNA